MKKFLKFLQNLFTQNSSKKPKLLNSNSNNTDLRPTPSSLYKWHRRLEAAVEVNWDFIQSLEGFSVKGYVPKEEDGEDNKVESGVTIGSGFDLGQITKGDLDRFKFTDLQKEKLLPYVGLKGQKARNKLKRTPLQLSYNTVKSIDAKVKKVKLNGLIRQFNEEQKLIRFDELPEPFQTVIASVYFQYGDLRRTPKFFEAVTNLNWVKAIKELEDFGDAFPTRRNKEADYMSKGLTSNTEGSV